MKVIFLKLKCTIFPLPVIKKTVLSAFSANYPPEIKNGNVTIEVTVGGNYSLVLNAVDENEGDTIFFLLNSDAPSGVTVNNATKTLTWVGVPDSNSMSIKITVSDGKAQSLWTPKIKLCKCKVS